MNEGAGLNAVELRRGSVVIHKHDAAAVACGSSDLRLLRIYFVIGEQAPALNVGLGYMLFFSALAV